MAKFKKYRKKIYRKKNNKLVTKKEVIKMIRSNVEMKWAKIANDAVVTRYGGSGPDVCLLNGITQGDTAANRIGYRINMKRVDIQLVLTSKPEIYARARILIFLDKAVNGDVIEPYTLFAGIGALDGASILEPLNPVVWPSKYTLLRDKTIGLGQDSVGDTAVAIERTVKFKILFKNKIVQYNAGNTGTVADMQKNALYIMIISDEATTDNQPACTIRTLLSYTDA